MALLNKLLCFALVFMIFGEFVTPDCYEDWSRCTPGTSFLTGILWKDCHSRCKELGHRGGRCVDSPSKHCPGVLKNNKQCHCY
uniref:Neuromacin n=1 Tax=Hirudo medicinalis TaxID=6421 RepID=NEURM_HIRME|nr:RecName: Full=Neuromacin; Flags: Precursor [Hirudo medicinalis]ABW97519.1 neuromacin [Hirudo medicinalis]